MRPLTTGLLGIFLLTAVSLQSFGQRKPKAPSDTTSIDNLRDDEVDIMVEIPAEFPGGAKGFNEYLTHNLKYPKKASRQKLTGNVYVELIVNADGSINDNTVKPVKAGRLGRADHPLLDPDCQREAVRLLKASPKWSPATRNGKPEQQAMVIAIPFKL